MFSIARSSFESLNCLLWLIETLIVSYNSFDKHTRSKPFSSNALTEEQLMNCCYSIILDE
jgi:hypothetical protein